MSTLNIRLTNTIDDKDETPGVEEEYDVKEVIVEMI